MEVAIPEYHQGGRYSSSYYGSVGDMLITTGCSVIQVGTLHRWYDCS